jgi:hypothetical protein
MRPVGSAAIWQKPMESMESGSSLSQSFWNGLRGVQHDPDHFGARHKGAAPADNFDLVNEARPEVGLNSNRGGYLATTIKRVLRGRRSEGRMGGC